MDKRCCAWQRRQDAVVKAPKNLEAMVKRILAAGVRARYLLMDSWFAMPATITALAKKIDVIGMVKKTSKIHDEYNGHSMDVKAIYRQLKKRRGRTRILARAVNVKRWASCQTRVCAGQMAIHWPSLHVLILFVFTTY